MRILHADALAALDEGRYGVRNLARADLPTGSIGFWDDFGTLTHDGVAYAGAPGRFQMTPVVSHGDMVVRGVEIVFSGLDSAPMSQLFDAEYHQRPVKLSIALTSVEGGAVWHVRDWFVGFIDQAILKEKGGGTSDLVVRCESIARELGRSGARTRSDADQRQIDADDAFLEHTVTSTNQPIVWGRSSGAPSSTSAARVLQNFAGGGR